MAENQNTPARFGLCVGKKTAWFNLSSVVAVLVIVKQVLLANTQLYAGPASTLAAMVVATILLHRKGASWRNLGFTKPQNLLATIGLTGLTILAFIMATQLMGLFADRFFEDVNYGTRFDHIEGNLVAYLTIMVVVWTHGSFFEELLFRAFIISNLAHGLGDTRFAFATALIASSVFFGYRHAYYQGIHGALITGAGGVAFGLMYLWFARRNVWPIILAHGAFNTLGQTFRFLGIEG